MRFHGLIEAYTYRDGGSLAAVFDVGDGLLAPQLPTGHTRRGVDLETLGKADDREAAP